MGRPCRCCSQETGCPECGTPRKTTLSVTVPSLPMSCLIDPCEAGNSSPDFALSLEFYQPFGPDNSICYYRGNSVGDWLEYYYGSNPGVWKAGAVLYPINNIAGVFIGWQLSYVVFCGPSAYFAGCSRSSPYYFNEDCTGEFVLVGNGDNQGPHPATMSVSG